ncbi:MAG TPA: FG-GAP-like repeat-containing protein [Candidatus Solibacter sp.]|nr:FG-GAP-like repeat-containing protein [Candidatus Solibacter sp.]
MVSQAAKLAAVLVLSFRIVAFGTTVSLTASSDSSIAGAGVTLIAAIDPPSATGKVTFYDGGNVLGVAGINAGNATMTAALQATGKRILFARYSGDAALPASTSLPLPHIVSSMPNAGYQVTLLSNLVEAAAPIGDFTGDGILDVAVITATGVAVFPGKGDGTLGSPIATDFAGRPTQIVAGDFDGDGKLDLIGVFSGVAILFGNGDGTFRAPANYAPLPGNIVAVADLNNDGFLDIVAARHSFPDPSTTISICLNKGDGSLDKPLSYPLNAQNVRSSSFPSLTAAVGDLDGDGNLDVVVVTLEFNTDTALSSSLITIFLGNGDGTVRLTDQSFRIPVSPGYVSIADLNGDGAADLVMGGDMITVFLGDGKGVFGAGSAYPTLDPFFLRAYSTLPQAVLVGDFNGDGKLDVAELFDGDLAAVLEIFAGNGDGSLQSPVAHKFAVPFATQLGPSVLQSGDFNGDGRIDFLTGKILLLGADVPSLRVSLSGPETWVQYQPNLTYTISVSNDAGALPTSGSVSLQVRADRNGRVILSSLSGPGWNCGESSCTRSDSLPPGGTYPPVTAILFPLASPGEKVLTTVVVSGGESPSNSLQHTAVILPRP